jgi:hypothetical protein
MKKGFARKGMSLLQALQSDAHVKAVDLAEALGISPSPLHRGIVDEDIESSGPLHGGSRLQTSPQRRRGCPPESPSPFRSRERCLR